MDDRSIGKSTIGSVAPVVTIDRSIGNSRIDWCPSPVETVDMSSTMKDSVTSVDASDKSIGKCAKGSVSSVATVVVAIDRSIGKSTKGSVISVVTIDRSIGK